jgi:hypothetical protein
MTSAPTNRIIKPGINFFKSWPISFMEMQKTTPMTIKMVKYPPAFFAKSAMMAAKPVILLGRTAQPLMEVPIHKAIMATSTRPRPSQTDHQSSVFQSFSNFISMPPFETKKMFKRRVFAPRVNCSEPCKQRQHVKNRNLYGQRN